MATGTGFKQKCPGCATPILIKDPKLIGKKVECPKCKQRFLIADPVAQDKEAVKAASAKPAKTPPSDEADGEQTPPPRKAPPAAPAKAVKKDAVTADKPKPKPPAKAPPPKDEDVEDMEELEDLEEEEEVPKAKKNGKPAAKSEAVTADKPKGKPTAKAPPPDKDEEDDEEEAPKAKKNGKVADAKGKDAKAKETKGKDGKDAKGKDAKGKDAKKEADEADEEEEDEGDGDKKKKKKKKKKKGGDDASRKKLLMGVALAGVGVAVLIIAFLFINKNKGGSRGGGTQAGGGSGGAGGGGENDPKKSKGQGGQGAKGAEADGKTDVPAGPVAGTEFTNLLPRSSQSVYQLNFKEFLDSPLGAAAFEMPGAFNDKELTARLGFSVKALDNLIHAENYSDGWTFTVLHTTQPIDEKLTALKKPLGLQLRKEEKALKNQEYFEITRNAHWLTGLGRLALGPPTHVRNAQPPDKNNPLYLRLHDPQTLVVAHLLPMRQFLTAEGAFPPFAGKIDPKGDPNDPNKPAQPPPGPGKKGDPGKEGDKGAERKNLPTFCTISPKLKGLLDKMAARKEGSGDKVIFVSAADMRGARALSGRDEDKDHVLYRIRPVWDVTNLLEEKKERIAYLGTGLQMKDEFNYSFQNALECKADAEAAALRDDVDKVAAPKVAKMFKLLLGQDVTLPAPPDKQQPANPPQDQKGGKDAATKSQILLTQANAEVTFRLDLVLDGPALSRLKNWVLPVLLCGLRTELEAGDASRNRHDLAAAGRKLGESGITALRLSADQRVAPDHYPPAAFLRQGKARSGRDPGLCVSWMAGLLPYLGHGTLAQQIKFNESWKDPANWLAARTFVPEFLDPSYPRSARWAPYPGMPLDAAATHYVGLAGIGPKATDYPAGDPEGLGKLGIFGYHRSTPLKAVREGRGLANTILMIRVPPDGHAGVTPWIAGGGSTVRTVPEKNSIEPFLTNENGKRGTYLLMTDGSVRYATDKMPDAVFKAMATVGPAPGDFDAKAVEKQYAPKVEGKPRAELLPGKDAPKPPPKKEPPPEKKEPAKGDAEKQVKFKTYSPPNGRCTVLMPDAQILALPLPVKLPTGQTLNMSVFAAEGPNKTGFTLIFTDYPPDMKLAGQEKQIFDAAAKQMTSQLPGAKILNQKDVTFDGKPGREMTVNIPVQGIMRLRMYLIGSRMYIVGVTATQAYVQSPEADRFLDSFKLAK